MPWVNWQVAPNAVFATRKKEYKTCYCAAMLKIQGSLVIARGSGNTELQMQAPNRSVDSYRQCDD